MIKNIAAIVHPIWSFFRFRSKNENRAVVEWMGWGSRFQFPVIWFNGEWAVRKLKDWKGNQSFEFKPLKILVRKKDSPSKSIQTVSTMTRKFSMIQKDENCG